MAGKVRSAIGRSFVAGSLATITILGSAGSICAAIALESTPRAVFSYFTRRHASVSSLEGYLTPSSARAIESLCTRPTLMNNGGLIYLHENVLVFHPHIPNKARVTVGTRRENKRLFPELNDLYHAAPQELITMLADPSMRQALLRRNLDPSPLQGIVAAAERDNIHPIRMKKELAPYLAAFTTYDGKPYELTLRDKLDFYENTSPPGRYAGIFEYHGLASPDSIDGIYAKEISKRNHYVAIFRTPSGLLVKDFHHGVIDEYAFIPRESKGGAWTYDLRISTSE